MGTELEGLELNLLPWLATDAALRSNGAAAHILGFDQGVANTVEGVANAIIHPVQTLQGIGNTLLACFENAGLPGSGYTSAMQIDAALGTNATGNGGYRDFT